MPRPTLLCLSAAVLLTACAPRAVVKPDLGSVDKGVYRNGFFGFSMPIPEDWQVEAREDTGKMAEEGARILTADGPEAQEVKGLMKEAMGRTLPLLTASRKTAPDAPLALVIVAAMPMTPDEAKASEEDTLRSITAMMRAGGADASELKPPHPVRLGGKPFTAMEYALKTPEGTSRQTAHLAKMKDHVVYVNLVYEDDLGLAECRRVLDKAKFR